jgi:hypothetical protein
LSTDIGETNDLVASQPSRVAQMHDALVAWRKQMDAKENKPNPNFDPEKFRELYIDVDASKFDPINAAESDWEKMWSWRKLMNSVASQE